MIDADLLLTDTKKQVVALVEDLRTVVASDSDAAAHIATEYERARAAGRTAYSRSEWAEGLYAQVAVAWVLACVFVRFCEDNDLIEDPLLGGPGIRSQVALDHRAAHLQANPTHDDRHWLRAVFDRLRVLSATGEIFGSHNPVWTDGFLPSADGARKLREALTRLDPDTGELRHDFTDPSWDTRFLGDLYQDLSEHAKKTYALLQTPVFVEEFILDRTLEPAIATFGLADTTIIDPTCGSGHFLLGAFARLFDHWVEAEPSTNRRELTRRAVEAIGGVDLNPFAASIARFRLLLAALRSGGDKRLADAPDYPIHIAVGDSLLHGDPPGRLAGTSIDDEEAGVAAHGYATEDVEATRSLIRRSWRVVVGNPPYITVKDPALNPRYRARFKTCRGKYSLGVPFTERFFQLAHYDVDVERSGFVGMITANSFMKREMGRDLIEVWLPSHDLTHIIDTGGAYIPGHGTPTVILFGRNRGPVAATVRAVMGIRGEPAPPDDPERGLVWSSIVALVDKPGSANEYVSVADLDRQRLASHPWSIGGGGAAELKERLDRVGVPLRSVVGLIGIMGMSNADEAFFATPQTFKRYGVEPDATRAVVMGDEVRDWRVAPEEETLFFYQSSQLIDISRYPGATKRLWPYRTPLWARATFGKRTYRDEGRMWWEWHQVTHDRVGTPSIVLPDIATHNHFAFSDRPAIYNRSAPIIQLPVGSRIERHLSLLAVLNSSVAGFWLKQVAFPKGGDHVGSEGARIRKTWWDERYSFGDAAKLRQFPVARDAPIGQAERLHALGERASQMSLEAIIRSEVPSPEVLERARREAQVISAEMIAAQERLDWDIYRLYGLVEKDLASDEPEPPLELGQRAFEIVLARRIEAGEEESSWFQRHRSSPIVDLPSHWTLGYRRLVERRIELIESDSDLCLIERPEYKRRWLTRPREEQVRSAIESWLLDRLEEHRYWSDPARITTVARLTAEARVDEDFTSVARLYAGRDNVDLASLITELVSGDSVAYLAALRYTDTGLRKNNEWLSTWDLQRREDAGEQVGPIAVPPRYGKADFNGNGWERRGKLDVPKERFITYPGAERETDASMVIGWAGWNHLDRARALAAWYLQARRDGRDVTHLTPLLAGLAELVPWLKQWYDQLNPDPAFDRPGAQIAALVETEMRSLGLTAQDLAAWRPEKRRSGRAKRATT